MTIKVLAGDIGGTKTMLALYERSGPSSWSAIRSEEFSSASYSDVRSALLNFLGEDMPDRIGLGVAGPVKDGVCLRANNGWRVDAHVLQSVFPKARICVINDFHAVALGIQSLGPSDCVVLQEGHVDPRGPIAVLGAGTGLGETVLVPDGSRARALPSEAGHADFAPRSDLGIELFRFLKRRGRVSVEHVVSGPGLGAIFDFVVHRNLAVPAVHVFERLKTDNPGAVVGEEGLAKRCPACEMALAIFVDAYGAEAGNLALRTLPTGGLFVAGGIAARITPALEEGTFMRAFLDKDPRRGVVSDIRVSVVTDRGVGLLGARAAAADEA